jgi:hypothetical protein
MYGPTLLKLLKFFMGSLWDKNMLPPQFVEFSNQIKMLL